MTRPDSTEYNPYYGKYIALVPGADIVAALSAQIDETMAFLHGLSEREGELRYAPDKWSIKEVIGHLTDAERIFSYRALRFARSDRTPLPGFEENDFVAHADFGALSLAELAAEYQAVRQSSIYMFKHLAAEAWGRRGVANNDEISVRAIAYAIGGHELHHLGIIRSRYLG